MNYSRYGGYEEAIKSSGSKKALAESIKKCGDRWDVHQFSIRYWEGEYVNVPSVPTFCRSGTEWEITGERALCAGSIVPALAKCARTGHPLCWYYYHNFKGWPPAQRVR